MDSRRGSPRPVTGGVRLGSWKEIAAYLCTSERTVQRWEQNENLPVHRHVHDKGSSIYAYSEELERWLGARDSKRAAEQRHSRSNRNRRRSSPPPKWVWWAAALILAAAVIWAWR